jgi:hypothetical protein
VETRPDYYDYADEPGPGNQDSSGVDAMPEEIAFHMTGVEEYLDYYQSGSAIR